MQVERRLSEASVCYTSVARVWIPKAHIKASGRGGGPVIPAQEGLRRRILGQVG